MINDTMAGNDFCRAVSQRGTPVTANVHGRVVVTIAKGGEFVCTQDPGHERGHASCDLNGHILARWPRKDTERYWQSSDCREHDHGGRQP